MEQLFRTNGKLVILYSRNPLIFSIDDKYYNKDGNIVDEPDYCMYFYDEPKVFYGNNPLYGVDVDVQGTDMPLARLSDCEVVRDRWDYYGNYGFIDKSGEYRIKPQYAYAYNFSCGLACVNLKRTWRLEDNGRYYYRNHFGYIDQNGRTVIEFKYCEAHPFNKYGVAWARDEERDYLIDTDGEIVRCLDYENLAGVYCKPDKRFMNINLHDLNGLYDTKSRKMVFEPMNADYLELEDEIVVVQYRGEDYKDIYYIE